jgi:hypothetical protein
MPEAKINETCIIGLPTCGYAFSSSRMAFIATPADDEFRLELEILQGLLNEKDYESYIALLRVDPAKLAFCTKICSKIITSQFCIVLLNSSTHRAHPGVRIPNPNVHLEYGLMLAFKKHVVPFQREGDELAFNIRPLDTILYTNSTFKDKSERAIDAAILATATTSRPTRAIVSSPLLMRYIAVRGLRFTDVSVGDPALLFRLISPLGFNLLDGQDIVILGLFDLETAKEVVFRLKLLLQNLHQAKERFETDAPRTLTQDRIAYYRQLWGRLKAEIVISSEISKSRVEARVREVTREFTAVPWELLTDQDIQRRIDTEYESIGDV